MRRYWTYSLCEFSFFLEIGTVNCACSEARKVVERMVAVVDVVTESDDRTETCLTDVLHHSLIHCLVSHS